MCNDHSYRFFRVQGLTKTISAAVFIAVFCISSPSVLSAEIAVDDMVVLKGEEAMIRAETRGRLFRKGGERIEFFIDGRSIGRTLSGGDGIAFKSFSPAKASLYRVTVTSGTEEGNGLLLSLQKGAWIVFIDIGGSLIDRPFSNKPRQGSLEAVREISKRYPTILLTEGMVGAKAVKAWLKEHDFPDLPVVPWDHGTVFRESTEKGWKIKAVIGSPDVIESAHEYRPVTFCFDDTEDSEAVKGWEEIRKKLLH